MAEDTTDMQVMDTSSDPITGTPEQGTQQTGMPSPTMQRDEMPRFETLGPERQLELLNLFPNMERNAILGLMESGMSFEDALEQMNRMMQNPPPELRQDEMDMMKRLQDVGMSMAKGNTSGSTSDAEFKAYQDAVNMMTKDPQTGMPIRKFDFMNKSGALGAFGGEIPMRQSPEMREGMMMDRKRKNM